MGGEHSRAGPLRAALDEVRADLDRIIDGEIARLSAPIDAGGRPARPGIDRATVPPAILPPARTGPVGAEPSGDPGSRLDALARRLEGRLHRPRGRAAEPGRGPGEGRDAAPPGEGR